MGIMNFILILLAYVLIEIFIFKLFLDWLPTLWNKWFGTHTVIIADLDYSITEIRRNRDNKLIARHCCPNFSGLMLKAELEKLKRERQAIKQ